MATATPFLSVCLVGTPVAQQRISSSRSSAGRSVLHSAHRSEARSGRRGSARHRPSICSPIVSSRRSVSVSALSRVVCAAGSDVAAPSTEALAQAQALADELRATLATDKLQAAIARTEEGGESLGLKSLVRSWNEGLWVGTPLQGRLKEVFQKPLSLAAISFGMFTEPEGTVEFVGVTVVKGRAGGFSDNPDFYAVRSQIKVTTPDGKTATGVNTVKGYFQEHTEDPSKVTVAFDRVTLELEGQPAEERRMPKPASVDQWMLLMTPDFHVTRSSLGSFALLTRAPPPPSS